MRRYILIAAAAGMAVQPLTPLPLPVEQTGLWAWSGDSPRRGVRSRLPPRAWVSGTLQRSRAAVAGPLPTSGTGIGKCTTDAFREGSASAAKAPSALGEIRTAGSGHRHS